jgi:hypothetical protein
MIHYSEDWSISGGRAVEHTIGSGDRTPLGRAKRPSRAQRAKHRRYLRLVADRRAVWGVWVSRSTLALQVQSFAKVGVRIPRSLRHLLNVDLTR